MPSKLSSDQEAIFRTAISRAYYAAFIQARNYLRDKEKKRAPDRNKAHQFVINQFQFSPDAFRTRIGRNLKRLRENRNLADYEDTVKGLRKLTTESLRLARFILTDLARL